MKTLRLLTPLVIFCCLFTTTRAQFVTIPDANFVTWLQVNYPTCMNGNQMDTTCAAIVNATDVVCANKNISDLTGIQYFDNLLDLNCGHNAITTLPVLPATLSNLTASYNRLTTLGTLPVGLQYLYVDSNLLTTLPALPVGLLYLYIGDNNVSILPPFPPQLLEFNCRENNVTTLPSFPSSLTSINVEYNNIDSLPALPAGLQHLSCTGNRLNAVPALPATLTWLNCSQNSLTALPALPAALNLLYCSANALSILPSLPAGLNYLDCSHNQLDSLPVLGPALTDLSCQRNWLTALPALPASIANLACGNNLLTSLPELPDSLRNLSCINNPYLHCLPRLKSRMVFLSFDSANIACVPNYVYIIISIPNLNNVPLCEPGNPSGCISSWNIAGKVHNDTSADCTLQTGEEYMAFLKINLLQNNSVVQQAYTGGYGVYSFLADTGNYTITVDTAGLPFTILCPVSGYDSATIVPDTLRNNNNFALQCKPGYDIAAWSIASSPLFRPAAFVPVSINAGDQALQWKQNCNTVNLAGQLITTITGPAKYIGPYGGALTPDSVAGNVLIYNIANWSGVNPYTNFDIIVQPDTTAQAGQQICIQAQVTPTAADNDSSNNLLTNCFTVVASYDPNIKEVYPAADVPVTGSRWLTYTVHFQNTGNSYAENIFITDTLDADVEVETFSLLGYSFRPEVTLKGNAIRFNFYQIMLIDSLTDEPNSHGYVQYKVKIKDNAPVGTVINNTAFIYFDFNAPVVTNTTTNTLTLPNGITAISNSNATMQLYPNPAQDVVMINLSDNLTGGTLTLSDVTGRSLNTISITSTHNQLNTGALASGVYLVTAVKGGTRVVQRLVVGQ